MSGTWCWIGARAAAGKCCTPPRLLSSAEFIRPPQGSDAFVRQRLGRQVPSTYVGVLACQHLHVEAFSSHAESGADPQLSSRRNTGRSLSSQGGRTVTAPRPCFGKPRLKA